MKSSQNLSPVYRRKFLGFIAATAASFGITSSFGNSASKGVKRINHDGNVLDFGAKGDGKTDDTAAVQSAVNAGSGSVYFPKGVYLITKTIELNLDNIGHSSIRSDGSAQIIMAGPGPAFKVIGTHFKSAAPQNFSDDIWTRQRMPMLDNLAITGGHPEAVGVEAVGTMQLTVTRVHIRKALHGIHLKGNNRNLTVSDCHLYENKGAGIYYDNVNLHQSNITGCHISYNAGGGIVSKGGNVRNIHITGCDIESNMAKDTPPTANIFIDCSTSEWGTAEVVTGCTIQHNSTSPDSANIRIIGGSRSGTPPVLKRWGNVTITGNIVSDVMINIHLKDCRGVTISNNTFWKGFRHHLLLEGCSNIVMGTNLFDFSPNIETRIKPQNSLRVLNCEDCTFTGLQIIHAEDTAGLLIEDSRRMNITNCSILDCNSMGLLLRNVTHSIVSGCLIKNGRQTTGFAPLTEVGSEGNLIVNNLLS